MASRQELPAWATCQRKVQKTQRRFQRRSKGGLLVFLLGQAMAGDPVRKESFERMEGGAGGRAEAMDLNLEGRRPKGKVGGHKTVLILSY